MNFCAVGKRKIALNTITQVQAHKLQVIERESRKENRETEKKNCKVKR